MREGRVVGRERVEGERQGSGKGARRERGEDVWGEKWRDEADR